MLAATLGANYGIYGPAFELLEHVPREPGSEEYLHSEKYELRHWDLDAPDSLRAVHRAGERRSRRDNPALQRDWSLRVHADRQRRSSSATASRAERTGPNVVLVVVNLDPHHRAVGLGDARPRRARHRMRDEPFQVHDLLTDARYLWHGARNFVQLDPARVPAHVSVCAARVRSERDFDYFA